jgi:predicted Rossmann fold nucleotide-binding protein DprA/Smf involved in DNA uptake
VDTLVSTLDLGISEVLSALSGLVLDGKVRRAGGNRYSLAAGFDEGPAGA